MSLTDEQKNEFLKEIGDALLIIRSSTRNFQKITTAKQAEIHNIADRLHNIPKLIAAEKVDMDRLISEINIENDGFRERALQILEIEHF